MALGVENCPKQFLSLMSEKTMLQQTYERFHKWLPKEKIFILTTEQYIPLVKEQLGLKDNSQLIIEPVPRDTGPCITLAACHF
ncbi:hypothetical protein G3M54_01630 [Bacillus megaterium NBRC 15308 = ATCC 14581]|nr:hypothetical protein [Priestia megaterium NBRC 15308 = ATCC 14581]